MHRKNLNLNHCQSSNYMDYHTFVLHILDYSDNLDLVADAGIVGIQGRMAGTVGC